MDQDSSAFGQDSFKYVFGEKDDVLIVLFYGKLTSRDVGALESCEAELRIKNSRIVIVSFRDLQSIAPGVYVPIARIQKTVRDLGRDLGICGLRPDIKQQLLANGIIRESEMFGNVHEAWKVLNLKKQST